MGVGALILAAGASSRMGTPKQLLRFGEESLLRHTIRAAIDAHCSPVFVVLGANGDVVERELSGLEVVAVHNAKWESGLASSIRAGIEAIADENVAAVVILVSDQPHVTPQVISQIVHAHEAGCSIVASTYGGSYGVPALFTRAVFPELAQLQGALGAKQVIATHVSEVRFVAFEGGEIDIDTPGDYAQLLATDP